VSNTAFFTYFELVQIASICFLRRLSFSISYQHDLAFSIIAATGSCENSSMSCWFTICILSSSIVSSTSFDLLTCNGLVSGCSGISISSFSITSIHNSFRRFIVPSGNDSMLFFSKN
jgi:hypothetical protein